MTKSALKKLLNKCECRISWDLEVIVLMPSHLHSELEELLGYDYLCEGGIECRFLPDGNIGFDFTDIFLHFGLDVNYFRSCFEKGSDNCEKKYTKAYMESYGE